MGQSTIVPPLCLLKQMADMFRKYFMGGKSRYHPGSFPFNGVCAWHRAPHQGNHHKVSLKKILLSRPDWLISYMNASSWSFHWLFTFINLSLSTGAVPLWFNAVGKRNFLGSHCLEFSSSFSSNCVFIRSLEILPVSVSVRNILKSQHVSLINIVYNK